jgi:hypothetical protein
MLKENFGNLFEGEELSEEFKEKATLVFEAAVSEKAKEQVEEITQGLQEKFDDELGKIHEELVEKIDNALNYFVEGWMEENKIAISAGIRTDIVENFIVKLKDLFVESYIDVPEDKVEYVSEMEQKFIDMEEKLNEQVQKNIDLNAKIGSMVQESIFVDVAKGLAESESEKLKGLVKSVEFISESDYKEKLETLRENYFPKVGTKTETIDESVEKETIEPVVLKEAEYIQTKYANI